MASRLSWMSGLKMTFLVDVRQFRCWSKYGTQRLSCPQTTCIGLKCWGRGLFQKPTRERGESPGKMATAGSSERPACPPCPTASRYPSKSGAGLEPSPPEHEEKFSACVEGQSDCSPPSGQPAHPPSPTQRHICSGERLHRRSDPERSSTRPARKDCDSRRGQCDLPRNITKRLRGPLFLTTFVSRLELCFKFSNSRRPSFTDEAQFGSVRLSSAC